MSTKFISYGSKEFINGLQVPLQSFRRSLESLMGHFSSDKSQFLDKLITDCITYRLDQNEAMEYIKEEIGEISLKTYKRRKKELLDDESTNIWLNYFTRIGFVKHLKRQIDDIERIQEDSQEQLRLELKKEERNNKYILALKNDIRQNSILLAQYGLSTPIIARLKARLKKKIADNDTDTEASQSQGQEQMIEA